MKAVVALLGAAATLCWPHAASAQHREPMPDISREQFIKTASDRFATMDQNGDGALTQAEVAAGPQTPGMRLQAFDADGNGNVTRAEFTAGMAARFDRMDGNRDGVLTADERRAARGQRGQGGRPKGGE